MQLTLARVLSVVPALLLITASTAAAKTEQRGPLQTFEGVVRERDWRKAPESYCHGGGNYYVLETPEGDLTLGSLRADSAGASRNERLRQLEGRTVQIVGSRITVSYSQAEHCPDPMMQCVSGPITCAHIEIQELGPKSQQ